MTTAYPVEIFKTEDGQIKFEVQLKDETVWLSQKLMAELFQKDVRTINEHLKKIYSEGELEIGATIRKFRIVQTEGKRQVARQVDCYNLDVIISVGYRVKSQRGVQFRQWATQTHKQHLIHRYPSSCYTSNPMIWSVPQRGVSVLRTMRWSH